MRIVTRVCQHATEKDSSEISECRACGIGYFKDTDSDTTACTACRPYSSTAHTHSMSIEQYMCNWERVLDRHYVCAACVPEKFKELSTVLCVSCDDRPQHFVTGHCVCQTGWTWNGWQCAVCEAGKFKSNAGWSFCETCLDNLHLVPGSVGVLDCLCADNITAIMHSRGMRSRRPSRSVKSRCKVLQGAYKVFAGPGVASLGLHIYN